MQVLSFCLVPVSQFVKSHKGFDLTTCASHEFSILAALLPYLYLTLQYSFKKRNVRGYLMSFPPGSLASMFKTWVEVEAESAVSIIGHRETNRLPMMNSA
jgi:hypothetical protein